MKLIITIILSVVVASVSGQVQRCGFPNYVPKKGEGNFYVDTCGRMTYIWGNNQTWYAQNNIVQESAPAISFIASNINISNSKIAWFKPSTSNWHDVVNGAWRSRTTIVLDSLLKSHNVWTGKNTFKDSVTVEKGLKSGGVVDTKGVNTEGGSGKTAMTLKGVFADKDTVITSSTFTLDGSYGTIGVNTSTGNKTVVLPITANSTNWTFLIRKETSDANTVTIKDASNTTIFTLYSKLTVKVKNSNNSWKKESVSIF